MKFLTFRGRQDSGDLAPRRRDGGDRRLQAFFVAGCLGMMAISETCTKQAGIEAVCGPRSFAKTVEVKIDGVSKELKPGEEFDIGGSKYKFTNVSSGSKLFIVLNKLPADPTKFNTLLDLGVPQVIDGCKVVFSSIPSCGK